MVSQMETTEHTRNLAKRLRRRMNFPEKRLWTQLRANRLDGVHFRRQHPIGPYILDFFCARIRLAVEVDGEIHNDDDRKSRDAVREAWLARQGVVTLHLPASQVVEDIEAALSAIRRAMRTIRPALALPSPPCSAWSPSPLCSDRGHP